MNCVIRILLAIILTMFCVSKAHATDWTGEEIAKEIAFQGLNAVDFYLTDRIIKNGGHEIGLLKVVMGEKPNTERLIITGVIVAVGHYYVTDYIIDKLPKYTKLWQNISIIGKVIPVGINYTSILKEPDTMCKELDNIFCKKDNHQCHLIDFIRSKDVRIKCYKMKKK